MIPAPMTGDDSTPDVAHLDATGSNGRASDRQQFGLMVG